MSKLTFRELLKHDPRYTREAYEFVFESLRYAQEVLGMGSEAPSELGESESPEGADEIAHKHLSGQQLCEAARQYALEQYGYMAKTVLNRWGLNATGDLGEIVFNLIQIGEMRKTKQDRREDFDDVFDFESGLRENYRIKLPKR